MTNSPELTSTSPQRTHLLSLTSHPLGSFRSGAEGFKTEGLARTAELRANEGHGSLLQFALAAAAGASSSEPLESFTDTVAAVAPAAKLSSAELNDEVGRVKAGIAAVKAELDRLNSKAGAAECKNGEAEPFVRVMESFHEGAKAQVGVAARPDRRPPRNHREPSA